MANHAAAVITRAGVAPVFTPAAAGDTCDVGDVVLHVKNGGGAPINVTVAATAAEGGLHVQDLVVAVPAGGERQIGPIASSLFANASDGKAHLSYSATTTVTVACYKL